jgi:hypothetical protein
MSVIENFNELSAEELKQFAQNLLDKINESGIFTSEVDLILDTVYNPPEANLAGNLEFCVSTPENSGITVERKASWQAYGEDAKYYPEDPDFEASILDDAKSYFKTLSTEIDGYRVSLCEILDADETEQIDVEVTDWTEEDGGIGSYEFWGHNGYDSAPYLEVEGIMSYDCSIGVVFEVEPIK